ncbi:hypothetical protein Rs2_02575 [Raphanus sativus]|nr:hypothetical protein Rs2_02575 [Raphanus sativus]
MTTNRFLCEVCNKGFKREQNLQLHGRVHDLPWNLKQKSEKEVRSKVYICPEPTCVHHDPSRALGDLTGIKKHYYRKHCEKKWKCGKCPKSYALQYDWKTHSKICGTKVCRSDCGTIFNSRDDYNSHKTFCNALKQESAINPMVSFPEMGAAGGGSGGRHCFYGGASSALGKQDFYASDLSARGGHGFYCGAASALPHNQFGNNSNTGLTPPAAEYNLNRSSSEKFEKLVPQPTNPNHGPTNFLMQCSSNQGLLAYNDQTLRSQRDLTWLGDRINNNNNSTNLGYFQNNTKNSNQALFTGGAANNDNSALLRGLTSSSTSLSSVVVNGFGKNQNGNLHGLVNSVPVTKNQQGWSHSKVFGPHFGNNLSMGRANMFTFDFLGVNGGIVSSGRNPDPLDTELKFSSPKHPFGNP